MINPIFASSARRRMRSMRTVLVLTLYGAMMLAFALVSSFSILDQQTMTIGSMRSGIDNYIYLIALQFVLLLLVAPGMTAGSIAGERERQTLDLILVTNTGAFRIAIGKLMESFGFLVLVILSSLPMMCVVFFFGGITVTQLLTVFLFMLIAALGASSIGLLASSLFKRTVTATVVSYLMVFAIGIGTLLPMAFSNETLLKYLNNPELLNAVDPHTLLSYIPKILLVNPGIGLLSLVTDQTGLMERTFYLFPSGNIYYQIFEKVDFGMIAWINMGIMFVTSLILTCVSALLIRPRAERGRKKGAKGMSA